MPIKPVHNESDLLEKIANDDEKAFAEIFYAYHNGLGEFILKLTDSVEMTEEIVQDVFVKVWLNRKTLQHVNKFTAYLFILSRNYTLNCIRKMVNDRKGQEQYNILHLLDNEIVDTDAAQDADNNYEALINRAVAQLPPQQQRVFTLRQKGLKNPEIAQQMNISTESVKKYQHWALKAVSEFLKAHAAVSSLLLIHEILKR